MAVERTDELRNIIETHPEYLERKYKSRLKKAVTDAYKNAGTVNRIMYVYDSGIAEKLVQKKNGSVRQQELMGWIKRLQDDFQCREDFAREGIKFWADAWGVELPPAVVPVPGGDRANSGDAAGGRMDHDDGGRGKKPASNPEGKPAGGASKDTAADSKGGSGSSDGKIPPKGEPGLGTVPCDPAKEEPGSGSDDGNSPKKKSGGGVKPSDGKDKQKEEDEQDDKKGIGCSPLILFMIVAVIAAAGLLGVKYGLLPDSMQESFWEVFGDDISVTGEGYQLETADGFHLLVAVYSGDENIRDAVVTARETSTGEVVELGMLDNGIRYGEVTEGQWKVTADCVDGGSADIVINVTEEDSLYMAILDVG